MASYRNLSTRDFLVSIAGILVIIVAVLVVATLLNSLRVDQGFTIIVVVLTAVVIVELMRRFHFIR